MQLPRYFAVYREDLESGSLQLLETYNQGWGLEGLCSLRNKQEEGRHIGWTETYHETFEIVDSSAEIEYSEAHIWNEQSIPPFTARIQWRHSRRILQGNQGSRIPILQLEPLTVLPKFWPKVTLARKRTIHPHSHPEPLPRFVAEALFHQALQLKTPCPITMEPLQSEQTAVTTCFHVFNKSALETWRSSRGDECPVCKKKCLVTYI